MVKMRLSRKSSRLDASSSNSASALATMSSTSSNRSSSKSTSWSSSSCSISTCRHSASSSPACPIHCPFSLPRGSTEFSFHFRICTGHIAYLFSLPGMSRICLVTSLTWIRTQGMRLSVGFALMNLSPSSTTASLSFPPSTSFGLLACKVQTMTRLCPRGSAIATTRAKASPRFGATPAFAKASSLASPPLTTPPLNTTSSSELSSSAPAAAATGAL
mmetsp:Transcript_64835/g.154790  ORF Transcript_64835/g.154790 Transcript_64835/m.154790 type:complete len:217 (-) Transcript_64835:465-1115(-)